MDNDKEAMDRIYAVISAALGRPFPVKPYPTRDELLEVGAVCAATVQLLAGIADEVERWEPPS